MSLPHEVTCPIPIDQLALLLRCPEILALETIDAMPPVQRAALAGFCSARAHMRDLALLIASRCDRPALERHGGAAGAFLFSQSREARVEPRSSSRAKPPVSLARRAS